MRGFFKASSFLFFFVLKIVKERLNMVEVFLHGSIDD